VTVKPPERQQPAMAGNRDEQVRRLADRSGERRPRAVMTDAGFPELAPLLAEELRGRDVGRACRPVLAHQALAAEPSIGPLLAWNVVVRATENGTVVEPLDPDVMVGVTGNDALGGVAADAAARLRAALDVVAGR